MLAGLFGGAKDEPHGACSFCGRRREEVAALVGGPGVSICDTCVPLSVAVLDEQAEGHPRFASLLRCCTTVLVGETLADSDRHRLAEAALLLAGDDPAALRVVAGATSYYAPHVSRRALESIPASSRTSGDGINHAVALYNLGCFAEALEVLDAIVPGDMLEDGMRTLNRIAVRLRLEPALGDEALEHFLVQLGEAAPHIEGYRAPLAGNRAECLVRLGRLREAERLLSSIAEDERQAIHHMLAGDVQLARGEHARALEAYRAAAAGRSPLAPELEGRLRRASEGDPYR